MPILKDLFTGKDGESHDIGRYSWAASLLAVIAAAAWNAVHAMAVDLVNLGTAIAAVVGAHGGALFFKKSTEPEEKK